MRMKMSFMVLGIWLFTIGNVLENVLKEFVRALVTSYSSVSGIPMIVCGITLAGNARNYDITH